MTALIPSKILGLRRQCVKHVTVNDAQTGLVFHCELDRRFVPVDATARAPEAR